MSEIWTLPISSDLDPVIGLTPMLDMMVRGVSGGREAWNPRLTRRKIWDEDNEFVTDLSSGDGEVEVRPESILL
jgi:hypothetical protein